MSKDSKKRKYNGAPTLKQHLDGTQAMRDLLRELGFEPGNYVALQGMKAGDGFKWVVKARGKKAAIQEVKRTDTQNDGWAIIRLGFTSDKVPGSTFAALGDFWGADVQAIPTEKVLGYQGDKSHVFGLALANRQERSDV